LGLGFVSAQSQAARRHAPSPKPRPNPKILAPRGYRISLNALGAGSWELEVRIQVKIEQRRREGAKGSMIDANSWKGVGRVSWYPGGGGWKDKVPRGFGVKNGAVDNQLVTKESEPLYTLV
jgi:hypothetical protein